jgi:hypothetical protein
LITFPLKGKIAWNLRFLPNLAEPPAELPSTKYISIFSGSLLWAGVNFPDNIELLFLDALMFRASSLAFFAAFLAREAINILAIIL